MEKLGSLWVDFFVKFDIEDFSKISPEIRVWLEYEKNNEYFTRRRENIYDSSMNSS